MRSWLKKFLGRFDSFIKNSSDEYQLNKTFVPDYKEVKQAHQLLLKEYVRAITSVSRLSFFIGLHEVRLPREGFLSRFLYVLIMKFSPFRLLSWKPLVNLFVEAHINKKLGELSTAYAQSTFLIQNSLAENAEYLVWLKQAKSECDEFRQTLSSGKIFLDTLKYLGTIILGVFLTAIGASSINDFLIRIFSNSLTPETLILMAFSIAIFIVFAPYFYLFWDITFTVKRAIFMGIGSEISEKHNIYVLENSVFKLLGRGKSKEFPADYLLQALYLTLIIIFLWYAHFEIGKALQSDPNIIVLNCVGWFSLPFLFILITDIIIPWVKRYSQGNM
jgi:hypothetical protein